MIPRELKAEAKHCENQMTRLKADKIKVEEWRLKSGERLIEVSVDGNDADAELEAFKSIVRRLMASGVKPLDRSKTEMGSECD